MGHDSKWSPVLYPQLVWPKQQNVIDVKHNDELLTMTTTTDCDHVMI